MKAAQTLLTAARNYLIFLLVFLPPLVFLPFWQDRYDFPKSLLILAISGLVIFLSGCLSLGHAKKVRLPRPVLFLLIPFLFSTAVSSHHLTSLFPQNLMYPHNLLHLTAMVFLAAVLTAWLKTKRQQKLTQLALYLVAGGLLVAIFSLVQLTWHWENILTTYRSRGTIGEPNRLGLYLAVVFPLALSLVFEKDKTLKILGLGTSSTSLVIILTTLNRTTWLSLSVGLSLFVLLKKQLVWAWLKHASRLWLSLFSVLIVLSLLSPVGKAAGKRLWAVKQDLATQTGSVTLRLESWREALKLFADQPLSRKLVGLGPNTATYRLLAYRDPDLNQKRAPDERRWRTYLVRNHYLHLLVNTGILGLAGFLVLIGITIRRFLSTPVSHLDKGVFAGFLVITVSSFFYYQTILTSLLFWIFLGILWSTGPPRRALKLPSPVFILLGLIITTYTFWYGIADHLAYTKNFSLATRLMPWQDSYWREWAKTSTKTARQLKSEAGLSEALFLSQKALSLNPLEVDNLGALQSSLYQKGVMGDQSAHERALEWGKQRLLADPARAGPYNDLGIIYLDLQQQKTAADFFKQALAVDPDYPPAYLHLGEALKQLGDLDQAEQYYRQATQRFPFDPVAEQELTKLLELKNQTQP